MTGSEWRIVGFTLEIAALSTVLIAPFGLAVAWLLARHRWPGKSIVETLVTLPLVMPPVATGLLLLKLFGRRSGVGHLLDSWGLEVIFTWRAVLVAMMVMSFPLFVRSCRVAFEEVHVRFEQVAKTLGASDGRVFFTISLPLARRGIVGGLVLAFARAIGEFGATILVAGDIPGRTRTLALAIYDGVQLGHDETAYRLLAVAVVIAFGALWLSEAILRRRGAVR
jgi:molybdate transport system permease protein